MNRSRFLIIGGLLVVVSILIGINGFGASLKQATLEVSNLSCGSCLTRIDDALNGCCGGGSRNGGCSASASTWKRLFNRQPAAPSAE